MANQVPAPIAVLSVSAFVDKLRDSDLDKVAWAVEVTARQLMRKIHGHNWEWKLQYDANKNPLLQDRIARIEPR